MIAAVLPSKSLENHQVILNHPISKANSAQIGRPKKGKSTLKKKHYLYPSHFSGSIPKKFGMTKKRKAWIENKKSHKKNKPKIIRGFDSGKHHG